MGKEGELWDDSLLLKAFDDAMSKYKKMHIIKKNNEDASDESANLEVRSGEAEENKDAVSSVKTETIVAPIEGNPPMDAHATEASADALNGLPTHDPPTDYLHSQGAEYHNQLLSQYYELEEKRQYVLQQLQQFGYQYLGEGYSSVPQLGTCSTSQENPHPAGQASHPAVISSCCPYVCQTLVSPCTAYPSCCSLPRTCCSTICVDASASHCTGKSTFPVKDDIVKTAMGAAGKAISSLRTTVNSTITEEIEKKKENGEEMIQSLSSETDLSDVLNAWYSAGFYTGKYLTEQSSAKKQHD